ncbi:hypothetical protein MMC07_004537 [Pseudocyphellaria aurata]|nr:hypothetical protein [Pseudocyphellaria aurata]
MEILNSPGSPEEHLPLSMEILTSPGSPELHLPLSMEIPTTPGSFELPSFVGDWQLLAVLIAWTLYLVALGLYRLYWSPLAKFPGPKLAGLTTWYQAYYDIWLRGRYVFKIKEMHAQYGPIIRINPHELHINDPEYIDEIYAGASRKRDKYRWISRMTIQNSFVTTISHGLHRERRAPLNTFFSKANIRRLEPLIHDLTAQFLLRMDMYGQTGEPMPMDLAFKAVTSDIINKIIFGTSSGCVTREDFNGPYFDICSNFFEYLHWMHHVSWLGSLIGALPIEFAMKVMPPIAYIFKLRKLRQEKIEEIKRSKNPEIGQDCMFYGLVHSDLPESDKVTSRIQQEAEVIVQAGQDTLAPTLSAIVYQLLSHPDMLRRLKAELADAIPDPASLPTCAQVDTLPYLFAVIQEVLRLHPGFIMRSQRVAPDESLFYDDGSNPTWVIPAGTPISMSIPLINTNPKIFSEPEEFRPDRWLENPKIGRYMLTFSRGTRGCMGINLAYQELRLLTAAIFRKYDLDDCTGTGTQPGPTIALYDTTRERDVDMNADMGCPKSSLGSKGVRLLVRS